VAPEGNPPGPFAFSEGDREALAPSERKYSILWIEEAKKEETRAARVEKAVELLEKGKSPK
jgi:uncharacterized protein YdeI (YjbR/CyaY-like superfamily)